MRAVNFCEAAQGSAPAPVDYFAFFGLPRKLNLDDAAWKRIFTS